MRVVVVGAGLTGLNCAAAMHEVCVPVEVYEKEADVGTSGPLLLHSSALRALELLDRFFTTLQFATRKIRTVKFLSLKSEVFKAVDVDVSPIGLSEYGVKSGAQFGTEFRSVRREDLARMLFERLPAGTVQFGREVVRVEDRGDTTLLVHFSDGSTAEADVVVGADGPGSVVRATACPTHPAPEPASWRQVSGKLRFKDAPDPEKAPIKALLHKHCLENEVVCGYSPGLAYSLQPSGAIDAAELTWSIAFTDRLAERTALTGKGFRERERQRAYLRSKRGAPKEVLAEVPKEAGSEAPSVEPSAAASAFSTADALREETGDWVEVSGAAGEEGEEAARQHTAPPGGGQEAGAAAEEPVPILEEEGLREQAFDYFQIAALLADHVPDYRWITAVTESMEVGAKEAEDATKRGGAGGEEESKELWPSLHRAYRMGAAHRRQCPPLAHGRVALLGAAGCALDSPTGLGTALAIEDGNLLAQRLSMAFKEYLYGRGKDLRVPLKDWNAVRCHRYTRVLRWSWGWGLSDSWAGVKFRNLLLVLSFHWLYKQWVRYLCLFDPRNMWGLDSYNRRTQGADARLVMAGLLMLCCSPFLLAFYWEGGLGW